MKGDETVDPYKYSQDGSHASVFTPLESLQRITLANNLLSPDLRGMGAACTTLTHIDVRGNKLSSLEGLQECIHLVYLNVSGNALSSLDGLPTLPRRASTSPLLVLDASHNVIKSKALKAMRKTVGLGLGELNISHNVLESLDAVSDYVCSPKYFPNLSSLNLSFNPCLINGAHLLIGGDSSSIVDTLLAACPHLSSVVAIHHNTPNASGRQTQRPTATTTVAENEDSTVSSINKRYSSAPPVAVLTPHTSLNIPTPNTSGGLNVSDIAQWPAHHHAASASLVMLPTRGDSSAMLERQHGSRSSSASGVGGKVREDSILDPYKPRRIQPSTSKRTNASTTGSEAAVSAAPRGRSASETPSGIEERIGGDSLRSAQDQLAVERQLGLHHMGEIKRLKKELAQKSRLLADNVDTVRQQRTEITRLNERVETLEMHLKRKVAEVDCARLRAELAEQKQGAMQTRLEVTSASYERGNSYNNNRAAHSSVSPNSRNRSHVDNFGNRHSATRKPHVRKPGDFPFAHKSYVYPEDEELEQVAPAVVLKHNMDHLNIGDEERHVLTSHLAWGRDEQQFHSKRNPSVRRSQASHHTPSRGGGPSVERGSTSPRRTANLSAAPQTHHLYPSVQFRDTPSSFTAQQQQLTRENLSSMGGGEEGGKEEALEGLCEAQAAYIDEVCEENNRLIILLERRAAELQAPASHEGGDRSHHQQPSRVNHSQSFTATASHLHFDPTPNTRPHPLVKRSIRPATSPDNAITAGSHKYVVVPGEENAVYQQHDRRRARYGGMVAGMVDSKSHSRDRHYSPTQQDINHYYDTVQSTPLSPPKPREGTVEPHQHRSSPPPTTGLLDQSGPEERTPPQPSRRGGGGSGGMRSHLETPPTSPDRRGREEDNTYASFHYSTGSIAAAVGSGSVALVGTSSGAAPPSKAASPLRDPPSGAGGGGGGSRGGGLAPRGMGRAVSAAPGIRLGHQRQPHNADVNSSVDDDLPLSEMAANRRGGNTPIAYKGDSVPSYTSSPSSPDHLQHRRMEMPIAYDI
jgi:hypothetical protein